MAVPADSLKDSALFKDFTATGLGIVAGIANERVVLAGQDLFTEGAPSTSLYFLLDGRLKVVAKAPDGKDMALGAIEPGEHLGELSLLGGGTRLATVSAEVDSKVIELKLDDFQKLQREKPQACMKLLMAVASEFGRKVGDTRDTLKTLLARAAVR